jgi:hypothetical protein
MTEAIHTEINILEIWLIVCGAAHLLHLYTFMVYTGTKLYLESGTVLIVVIY